MGDKGRQVSSSSASVTSAHSQSIAVRRSRGLIPAETTPRHSAALSSSAAVVGGAVDPTRAFQVDSVLSTVEDEFLALVIAWEFPNE